MNFSTLKFTKGLCIVAIVLGSSSCPNVGQEFPPPPSPAVRRVAYIAQSDVWVCGVDGSDPRNLTQSAEFEALPKWSPDGHWVFFLRLESGKHFLYRVRFTGEELARVTNRELGYPNYDISPTGEWVAISGKDPDQEVFLCRADGTEERRLTDNTAADLLPCFSPDGLRLAFISDRVGGKDNLFVMDVDGGSVVQLTSWGDTSRLGLNWSPDGTRILFVRYGNFFMADNSEVFTIRADGTDLVNVSQNNKNDFQPLWTGDGQAILFTSDRNTHKDVYRWTSGILTRLTDSPAEDSAPASSRDGSLILFLSDRDSPSYPRPFLMRPDGSEQRALAVAITGGCTSAALQP